jgi:heme-degrading monooxygenase HmoA
MAHVFVVHHKVKDYAAWKKGFDGASGIRRAGGEKSWQIFHPAGDPNDLTLLFEWDSLENAHAYFASPELRQAMKAAGVIGAPDISFLEEVDQGTL